MPKKNIVKKLSMFCGVPEEAVVVLPNAKTVYQVPLTLEDHKVGDQIVKRFGLKAKRANMTRWHNIVKAALATYSHTVNIGVVAKYLENEDAYLSVTRALQSAAWANKVSLKISWINAEALETGEPNDLLRGYDGLLVPGGFGARAVEGKTLAADYAMTHGVPYLGICLGMQVAVIAAARRAGLKAAVSTEVQNKAEHPVIYIMDAQKGKEATGGTMRLGNYPCKITKGSLAEKVYGSRSIVERHRHRYEVNQKYNKYYEKAGLVISGTSPDGRLVEMIEHKDHPYFIGTQAHPEFLSRPDRPHPLFDGLVKAAKKQQN